MKGFSAVVDALALMASSTAFSQPEITMKLRITVNGVPLLATLNDSVASRVFQKLLPLTLTLEDYAGAEKIATLARRLDTAGAPAGFRPTRGDIAFYAPWGNLALFYRDQPYARGLVHLGRIESAADMLQAAGPLHVTFDATSDPVK